MRKKERREQKGGGEGKEGVDAQEAHLYAFPLITGRGQWLPLHNGFASASHLLPASLGEEEVEERGGVESQTPENCWLANQTWQCTHTHKQTQLHTRTHKHTHRTALESVISLATNTYPIVRIQAGRHGLTQKGIRGAQDLGPELCFTANEAVKRGIMTKEALS